MNKEMIISSNGHETRVAILEDDQLAELFVEREQNRGVVGNVYKGRVSKVLPGMQSSFVDIGLERDGFLYVSDVINTTGRVRARTERRRRRRRRCRRRPTAPVGSGADGVAADGGAGGRRRRAARPRRPRRRRSRRRRDKRARAEDRRAAEGRAGRHRAGGQGAARHQGRAPDLHVTLPGPLPGVHADRRSHRRLAQDRQPRRARAPARHRQGVPRAAQLQRRRDHPHRGRRAARRKTSSPTCSTSTKIWTDMRQRGEQRALAGRRSIRSRAWSPSCCAIC